MKREVKDLLEGKKLYKWEEEINNIISKEPTYDRKIHWYWSNKGNKGKTIYIKHILIKYREVATFAHGKANDIAHSLSKFLDEYDLKIFLVNLTRPGRDHVSYTSLEAVKDGLMFSGKYDSRPLLFNPPHVIVFANWPPDRTQLSADRWHVVNVDD